MEGVKCPKSCFFVLCFCSFYFVGDEDLLEIIGNSKNITRLQKHFKKMFAGVHTLILDDDVSQVLGLASKEGEEVCHKNAIFFYSIKISWRCFCKKTKIAAFIAEQTNLTFMNLEINL